MKQKKKENLQLIQKLVHLDVHQADLIGISLSTKIGKACYIPIGHKFKGCLKKENVIKKLKPILEDKSVKKIGQNIKFDFIILYKLGINYDFNGRYNVDVLCIRCWKKQTQHGHFI